MAKSFMCYDFTLKDEDFDYLDILEMFRSWECKKVVFQKEKSNGDYVHFQGRIHWSDSKKKKKSTLVNLVCTTPYKNMAFSITSKGSINNDDYVEKKFTRVAGPWSLDDLITYLPRQIKEIKELYPFQKDILKSINEWDQDHINVIVDEEGMKGKSIIGQWVRCKKLGFCFPPMKNYLDLMAMAMCVGEKKLYMFDIPRAMGRGDLGELYSGIETIKTGFLFDHRYKFRYMDISRPVIWVLTNSPPPFEALSRGRWRIWKLAQGELIEIKDFEVAYATPLPESSSGYNF